MANNLDSTEQNIGLAHLKNKHSNSEGIQQDSLAARLMTVSMQPQPSLLIDTTSRYICLCRDSAITA